MDTENISLFAIMLNQIVKQNRFHDESFLEKLKLVCSKEQNNELIKKADINFTRLYQHIEEEFKKIKITEETKALVAPLKQPKVHRLYVDGVFDLTHSGHFNAIRQAK